MNKNFKKYFVIWILLLSIVLLLFFQFNYSTVFTRQNIEEETQIKYWITFLFIIIVYIENIIFIFYIFKTCLLKNEKFYNLFLFTESFLILIVFSIIGIGFFVKNMMLISSIIVFYLLLIIVSLIILICSFYIKNYFKKIDETSNKNY